MPEGWAAAHLGETWTFRLFVTLDDLISGYGIEGMNELCDDRTRVLLLGLTYAIGEPRPAGELGRSSLILEVTGEVAE